MFSEVVSSGLEMKKSIEAENQKKMKTVVFFNFHRVAARPPPALI
jgi:hypothetical protein